MRPTLLHADLHAVNLVWETAGYHGHGTGMAGLALYGNLTTDLRSSETVTIAHGLMVVKNSAVNDHNLVHLYSAVFKIAASRVEIESPNFSRIFSMLTTTSGDIFGVPCE